MWSYNADIFPNLLKTTLDLDTTTQSFNPIKHGMYKLVDLSGIARWPIL